MSITHPRRLGKQFAIKIKFITKENDCLGSLSVVKGTLNQISLNLS